jgi:homoserine dehydrogenase
VTRILGEREISIEAILQKEPLHGEMTVPIILLTHRIREKQMNDAIAAIEQLDTVHGEVTRIRVETLDAS